MSEITPAASQPGPTSDVGQCDGLSLPMETQIGDRFTDEEGEWEVVSHPVTLYAPRVYVHGSDGRNSLRPGAR
jgi:hypothetical protein